MELFLVLLYLSVALAFVDTHRAQGHTKIRVFLLSFIWPYCVGRYVAKRIEAELIHEIEGDKKDE